MRISCASGTRQTESWLARLGRIPELCTCVITHINYTGGAVSTCQIVMSHRGTKTNKSWVSKWVNNTQQHVWGSEQCEFVFLRLKGVRIEMAVLCIYIQPYCVVHYWLHKQSILKNGWSQRSAFTWCPQTSALSWGILHPCLYLVLLSGFTWNQIWHLSHYVIHNLYIIKCVGKMA